MGRLKPENLHIHFADGATDVEPITPRRYTLTHSDATGDLFLTLGPDYDRQQLGEWQVRLMRDEVLAEWRDDEDGPGLHVHCHVSGALSFGPAGWRYAIFRRELPLALEALCFGDQRLFETQPYLKRAPVWIHFHAKQPRYNRTERWGTVADYLSQTGLQ